MWTVLIAAGMLAALLMRKKVPEPVLIIGAGILGVLVQHYRG
jgi:chromate transport protein ChrA